jgi:SAM-dependent methyltransferase
LVQRGYNTIASRYLAARLEGRPDPPLLARFSSLLPPNALVLDAGCGAGVPVASFLSERHRVVAIDFALNQARMAASLVPPAMVACVDMTRPAFPFGAFDGVCSFYAILHVPRARHRDLIASIYRLLRDEGLILLCLGAKDTEAAYGPYFGARMYWSHFDRAVYMDLLRDTGFQILEAEIQPDPISNIANHLFVLARRGAP